MIHRICENLSILRKSGSVHGIELLFDSFLLFLRLFSISYRLTAFCSDPTTRSDMVDIYCVLQLVALLVCVFLPVPNSVGCFIAAYVLFEIYLNLFNIVFIGKFSKINAPPVSVERSLLLLLLNAFDVVLAFTLFYRHWMRLSTGCAFYGACLVLGTIGTPPLPDTGEGRPLIILQIFLDLLLIVLFLSSFAGQIGLFQREDRNQTE
jgi:hypothetical protein